VYWCVCAVYTRQHEHVVCVSVCVYRCVCAVYKADTVTSRLLCEDEAAMCTHQLSCYLRLLGFTLGSVGCATTMFCTSVVLMSMEQLLKRKHWRRGLLHSRSVPSTMPFTVRYMSGSTLSLTTLAKPVHRSKLRE